MFNLKSGGFKALLKIALTNWSYETCIWVKYTDPNPNIRKVADYVIARRYVTGPLIEEYADIVDA